MEDLKKSWIVILVTATLSILGSLLIMSLTFKRDDSNTIQKKIDEKASVVYVDKQDEIIRNEYKNALQQQSVLLQSIDSKLNILITKK